MGALWKSLGPDRLRVDGDPKRRELSEGLEGPGGFRRVSPYPFLTTFLT